MRVTEEDGLKLEGSDELHTSLAAIGWMRVLISRREHAGLQPDIDGIDPQILDTLVSTLHTYRTIGLRVKPRNPCATLEIFYGIDKDRSSELVSCLGMAALSHPDDDVAERAAQMMREREGGVQNDTALLALTV